LSSNKGESPDFRFRRTWGPNRNYPNVLEAQRVMPYTPIVIAGPCSIESEEQVDTIASELARVGVTFMRGGVFRAGTYPPKEIGLKRSLLRSFSKIARKHGLQTIIEVIDVRDIDYIDQYADAFQVGARQGQGYVLLNELSKTHKTVTLKRGAGMKLDEFLGAAEYLARGNCAPVLIERGISTFNDHCRWTLDISIIPAIQAITQIPIIVDASHGTGRRDLVKPMTMAGIAAGADGFLVEVHPCPQESLSDSDQAYPLNDFEDLYNDAMWIYYRDDV
jgi:3-deoxy-7-phosphoheptulonate synthase